MNILHFEMNVPKEVSLSTSQGTRVEGRYGNRVMFHLADGLVMYVPPIVATKIDAEGIAPGEPFELCKTAVKEGRRRLIEWTVRRIEPTQLEEPENASPEAPEPKSELEHDLTASIEMANALKADARGPHLVKNVSAEAIPPFAPISNGNGNHSTPAQNGNGHPPPPTKLEHALKTAISAAHNAEKFGAELGYVVRFDADAIKSMAITVLINMSGENRR